jgi:hypothetical protein
MGLPTYNSQQLQIERRYFVGITVLRKGQVLCYQEDAALTGNTKTRLGMAVEVPTANNLNCVAGFVCDSSAGLTGPCFVDVIVPRQGDVLQVECDGTANIAVENFLELDVTLGGLIYDASRAATVTLSAIALEAWTTDATLKAIWVYIL